MQKPKLAEESNGKDLTLLSSSHILTHLLHHVDLPAEAQQDVENANISLWP